MKDRGRTNRVSNWESTFIPLHAWCRPQSNGTVEVWHRVHFNLWPWPVTLIFSPKRAIVMTHTCAKDQDYRSLGSKVRLETDDSCITFCANVVGNNSPCKTTVFIAHSMIGASICRRIRRNIVLAISLKEEVLKVISCVLKELPFSEVWRIWLLVLGGCSGDGESRHKDTSRIPWFQDP